MLITAKMLEKKGASCGQVAIFREEWPKGARVTKKNCLRAAALDLDIDWAAVYFLPRVPWAEYNKATLAEY